MKLICFSWLLAMLTAMSSPAATIQPYLGFSVQANAPVGSFAQTDVVHEDGGAREGAGGQGEFGLTGPRGSVYVGYRVSQHRSIGHSEFDYPRPAVIDTDGKWKFSRMILGGRWFVLDNATRRNHLLVGGGVTTGNSQVEGDVNSYYRQQVSETSTGDVGWFGEVGVMLGASPVLSVCTSLQYHAFNPEFSTEYFSAHPKVSFIALQIGLLYIL